MDFSWNEEKDWNISEFKVNQNPFQVYVASKERSHSFIPKMVPVGKTGCFWDSDSDGWRCLATLSHVKIRRTVVSADCTQLHFMIVCFSWLISLYIYPTSIRLGCVHTEPGCWSFFTDLIRFFYLNNTKCIRAETMNQINCD